MKKTFKWIIRILVAIVLAITIFLSAFALVERITFFSFYKNSQRYHKIPALSEGYVAQGYCLVEDRDFRLSCGYMNDGTSSRIYVIPDDGSDVKKVIMKKDDGSNYDGHTGGIAVMGDFVYVTGKTGCDVFSLTDILDGDGQATQISEVKTINDPAYCYVEDNILYAGSFYREGNYETPEEHRLISPAGDSNMAIISAYALDPSTGGTYSDVPNLIISTTSLAQGMALVGGDKIAISTSYGISKSHIYVYDLTKAAADEKGFDVSGVTVPLLYLDSSCLVDDIIAPPMAEQIIYDDGVIYIMNESASNKYIFGKLTSGAYVYGYSYAK